MFLGRSLQGSVSLLNDNSSDQAASPFEQHQQQMASQPPPPPSSLSATNNSTSPAPGQTSPPPPPSSATAPTSGAASHISNVPRTGAAVEKKRNHICQTCSKAFTTSGHLARHIRVHTGERNHKCPFPGCETRCSRQDNLQQQYVSSLLPFFLSLHTLACPPYPVLSSTILDSPCFTLSKRRNHLY